jgi:hypothetical protein
MTQPIDSVKPEKDQNAVAAPVDTGPAWMPKFAKDTANWVHTKGEGVRRKSIEVTPAFAVNNASNILAFMHIGTEVMMFKSGMGGKALVKDWSNPVNWVKQPAQEIWKDIYSKGKSNDYTLGQLLKGNPIENLQHWLNPHEATLRAIEREPAALQPNHLKTGSPWQTRTTLMGLAIWTLSAVIPERKESDEQIEHMAKMRTLHPVQYVGTRLKQAVWFPEWNQHKREMLGLGYLGIGVLSGIGSWFNRAAMVDIPKERKADVAYIKNALETRVQEVKTAVSKGEVVAKQALKDVELIEKALEKGHCLPQRYNFNAGYLFTSIVSFAAGLPLLFALDERKAYSTYGAMSVFRLPFLYTSIGEKMKKKEQGWQYYAGSKISFQLEDALFSVIGGATKKKRSDGTYEITDHEALKKKAVFEAREEKLKDKEVKVEKELLQDEKELQEVKSTVGKKMIVAADMDGTQQLPTATVLQVAHREHAMPERVAQEQQAARAV